MCGDVKDMLQMFSALAMLQKKKKKKLLRSYLYVLQNMLDGSTCSAVKCVLKR